MSLYFLPCNIIFIINNYYDGLKMLKKTLTTFINFFLKSSENHRGYCLKMGEEWCLGNFVVQIVIWGIVEDGLIKF